MTLTASAERALLTPDQVAALLSVDRRTLRRLVAARKFPQPIRLSTTTVRWDSAAIARWLDSRRSA